MPTYTLHNLPKPLGNEAVSRANHNALVDAIEAALSAAMPVGAVLPFAMITPPTGWLECNGAAVSRETYSRLFTAIGTTFGAGNGTTTFNIPDLRGEFVRGWDHVRGADIGRVFGSAQADELKEHTHTLPSPTGGAEQMLSLASTENDDEGHTGADLTGSTGGAETRPRNVALLYCIKY